MWVSTSQRNFPFDILTILSVLMRVMIIIMWPNQIAPSILVAVFLQTNSMLVLVQMLFISLREVNPYIVVCHILLERNNTTHFADLVLCSSQYHVWIKCIREMLWDKFNNMRYSRS
jgi:hypothetical protein